MFKSVTDFFLRKISWLMKLSFLIISVYLKIARVTWHYQFFVCQMVSLLRITLVWWIRLHNTPLWNVWEICAPSLWRKFIYQHTPGSNRVSSNFPTIFFPLTIILWRKKLLQILPIQFLCFKGNLLWNKILSMYKNLNDLEQFQGFIKFWNYINCNCKIYR